MKIMTRPISPEAGRSHRRITVTDIDALGVLMDRSYTGKIDHEGETPEQCRNEMKGTLEGKYGPWIDFASFVATDPASGLLLSASIVTFWKEMPLLAFSMTDPSARGQGLAGFLIERSIDALARNSFHDFYLVVTQGNDAAERVYRRLGFELLGPALPKQPPA
jgi:GNAT superfamily N-acetyltransferase